MPKRWLWELNTYPVVVRYCAEDCRLEALHSELCRWKIPRSSADRFVSRGIQALIPGVEVFLPADWDTRSQEWNRCM